MNQAVDALAERAIREHWEFRAHRRQPHRPPRVRWSAARFLRWPRPSSYRRAAPVPLANSPRWPDPTGNPSADDDGRMDRLSRSLLEMFLRRELFSLEEMRTLHNNPQRQVGYIGVGSYVQRDYAPLPDRLRSATSVLQQVPDFLNTLDGLTEPELGETRARDGRRSLPGHGVVL